MKEFVSAVNYKNQLEVFEVDSDSRVLILNHSDAVNVDRCQTEMFDTENDLMEFVQQKKMKADQSYNLFFETRAYEIINEHYIKLFYNTVVSNA